MEEKSLSSVAHELAPILGKDLATHHKKWLEAYDLKWDRRLQLSPRGHGKTTIWGFLGILSILLMNPKTRVLIISKTEGIAARLLGQIKSAIETKLTGYPEFETCNPKNRTELRLKMNDHKEPSITACGVGGSITGMHYDYILCDDIIDEMNSATKAGRAKISEWFKGSLLQLALPHTRLLVLGTRKHPEDIYSEFINNPAWSVQVEKAIIRYPNNFKKAIENGEPLDKFFCFSPEGKLEKVIKTGTCKTLWRKEWGTNRLLLDRLLSGSLMFDREKQNDVSGMSGNIFQEKWIKYWKCIPERTDLDVYMACDLAISDSENADLFSLVVVGVNGAGNWFLLDEVSGRFTFLTQQELIIRKVNEWNPEKLGIEDIGYQRVMIERLREQTDVQIVPISHSKTSKQARIRTLQPLFEEGRVFIGEGHGSFKDELLEFPKGSHDDRIDAFEMAVRLGTSLNRCARIEFL